MNCFKFTLEFYQQETVEVDGVWYISVKGIAKAYNVKTIDTIKYHIKQNSDIFKEHVFDEKFLLKDLVGTMLSKSIPDRLWLDKFAFIEIGSLLRSSPKTIPIISSCR